VGSHEGGAPKGVNLRVLLNLRRTHEYMNLPLCKQLSFDILASLWFPRKDIFPRGPWDHIIGERSAWERSPWGRSLRIHIEIKRRVVV
jgi:hypothetical protein